MIWQGLKCIGKKLEIFLGMAEGLYFIGILPPEDIKKKITDIKHVVARKFGSKHALNSPPHITLRMPFKWKDKKIDDDDEESPTDAARQWQRGPTEIY